MEGVIPAEELTINWQTHLIQGRRALKLTTGLLSLDVCSRTVTSQKCGHCNTGLDKNHFASGVGTKLSELLEKVASTLARLEHACEWVSGATWCRGKVGGTDRMKVSSVMAN